MKCSSCGHNKEEHDICMCSKTEFVSDEYGLHCRWHFPIVCHGGEFTKDSGWQHCNCVEYKIPK
jgi:hypothetical protein